MNDYSFTSAPQLKRDPLGSALPESPSPLSLHLRLSLGSGELKVPSSHPIFAAFRRGIEEGAPTGNWRFLVVRDSLQDSPTVIGTFVHTKRGRLLFFSGADIEVSAGSGDGPFDNVALDHLTLDQPRTTYRRSHLAVRGVPALESRGLDYRAPLTPGFMFPWFSFLLPDLRGFSKLPAHLWVEFPQSRKDLDEYGRHLIAEGGVILFPLPPPPGDPHYVQFDVWVGTGQNWRTQKTEPLAWAYKPELVTDSPQPGQEVRAITTDTEFGDGGIRVIASRPQGRLLVPRILRPRFKPQSAA